MGRACRKSSHAPSVATRERLATEPHHSSRRTVREGTGVTPTDDWMCEAASGPGYRGHALATGAGSGWRCSRCGVHPDCVIEVDALALMLDGHCDAEGWRVSTGWVRELERNGEESGLAIRRDMKAYREVAQAIFELESLADWRPFERPFECNGWPFILGDLAESALRHVGFYSCDEGATDATILEAAACLRDGWRPRWGCS